MPSRHAHRQAQLYRQRSRLLQEEARTEFRDEARKRFMLDLAQTYLRTADALAPEALQENSSFPDNFPAFRRERKTPARDSGRSKFSWP